MPSAPGAPAPSTRRELPRTIGLASAIAIAIGSTIGSGIFRSPAGIADKLPGPLPLLAVWVAGGLFALCGALTLAEVGSAFPSTGGQYVYAREAWGRTTAFVVGWSELVLIRAASLGAISLTFGEYLLRVLGYDPRVAPYNWISHVVAAVAIAVAGTLNARGVRLGSLVQWLTTAAKYGGLVFIVILAVVIGLPKTGGHFTPAMPAGSFSVSAFGLALVSVLWAFDGWADLTRMGGEIKDAERTLPRALVTGALMIVAIYLLANVAYLIVLPVEEIRTAKLVAADVAERLIGRSGVVFVSVTVMLSTFGALNAVLMTSPRIFFAMADDGMLFKPIAKIHPTWETPYAAIALATVLGIAFVMLRDFEQLADLFVTASIPTYMLSIAAVYRLRRRPGYAPPVRVPFYPVVPALFLLANLFLLGNAILDPATRWGTLGVLGIVALGAVVCRVVFPDTKSEAP
jgi:basic amino acid/polyamine antiporter, APA family